MNTLSAALAMFPASPPALALEAYAAVMGAQARLLRGEGLHGLASDLQREVTQARGMVRAVELVA